MNDVRIKPLLHQQVFKDAVRLYDKIRYFWFIGGYRCGKSNTICQMIIDLAIKYSNQNVVIGVGAPTISLAKKTFILDLEILLNKAHIYYYFNKQDNVLILNGVKFILIAISYPADIYGYTFNAFLCDELDELPQHYGHDAFTAIDERCSQALPDGRKPFLCFFSTAQGYKTVYSKVNEMKDKKIPYILVRGRTKDNIYIDPSYYESRYALYTENERLAFLEGFFVNLTTGMVFPEYQENAMMIEPFEVRSDDIIYIGQDLNMGYSKAVCMVKRDKKLYIIKTFSFEVIGNAPTIIRNTFPDNDIFWFPDASSNELMIAYAMEIRNKKINLRMSPVNPSILERIFLLNKLLKSSKMFLFKECKALSMALKTHQYDKIGKPEKGQGENSPDHLNDALAYVVWRIVMSDNDFSEFRNISKSAA